MGLMDLASKLTAGAAFSAAAAYSSRRLTKAKFMALNNATDKAPIPLPGGGFMKEVFLNPASVKITRSAKIETNAAAGVQNPPETRSAQINPMSIAIPTLIWDTYESRESVRHKHIEWFEHLVKMEPTTHGPPAVRFIWGEWGNIASVDDEYVFLVEELSVNYTMFLPDGTPVRAEMDIKLKQAQPPSQQEEPQSPDHAKLYTVRRGDTLQGIATYEYENPAEWRRIADLNGISNPLDLTPGTKLLVPPILK